MVFVAGPRQVGKTTMARALPGGTSGYLSWDDAEDREKILLRQLPASRLWIFDELHKYRGFENTKRQDYYNKEFGLILEDMHDENVIAGENVLFFIDTVFYVIEKK